MQRLFKKRKIILRKTLTLLLLVSIFALIFTACGENNNGTIQNSSKSSNTVITRPSKTETANSSKKSTTPTTPKSSSIQNSKPVIPNTTEYSDLLFHILINDEVNALIEGALENPEKFNGAEFDSHPYSLLQRLGHDVEGIKSGKLKCRTVTMVENDDKNSLYMAVMAENAGEIPYYTQYMLKCTLTEKEMQDYNMLYSNQYYQSYFINDQISKEKTVEIVSQANIAVETHEWLENDFKTYTSMADNTLGTNKLNIMLKSYNQETKRFTIHIFSNPEDVSNSHYTDQKTSTFSMSGPYTTNNTVFWLDVGANVRTMGQDIMDCKANIKKTTVFYNQIFDITSNADLNLKNKINLENN